MLKRLLNPEPKGKTEMENEKKNAVYVICRGYGCGYGDGIGNGDGNPGII